MLSFLGQKVVAQLIIHIDYCRTYIYGFILNAYTQNQHLSSVM